MNNYFLHGGDEARFLSDLASERRRADVSVDGISYNRERCPVGTWERINIYTDEGEKSIGRPRGNYDTLNTRRLDLLDYEGIDDAKNEIAEELCSLFDKNDVFPRRILVVGFGNRELAPDSIGPLAASKIKPTLHISKSDEKAFSALECSEIAVFCPGVTARSGLDSAFITESVCRTVMPDAVIAIDALASRSPDRLGTTVQICDTGIFPGTGLGNGRSAVSKTTLGIPVFAIGVPTVMDSRLFGDISERGMFVSPKDINGLAETAADIIAGGINQAFGIDF